MNIEPIIDLMQKCEESKFWGAVKFNFKDGNITHVELLQTLRPQAVQSDVGSGQLLILALPRK